MPSALVFDDAWALLAVLGWGPMVAVVGAVASVHGLLIAAGITGPAGLMEYL